jgi:NAD(P)-dependent dehydrogenase (short-subunit alcohol dehydrogenase family)
VDRGQGWLAGRTAVVTGGAGGLGLALARRAHARGMRVVLADVEEEALARAVESLRATGAEARGEVVDVADDGQVAALAHRCFAGGGEVGLLVNNAGVGGGGLLWEASDREWRWVLGVNVLGVASGIRHFVPRMLEAERRGLPGHVVNVASAAGWLSPPLLGVYAASKAAVIATGEALFHELRSAGSRIGVTVACPAFFPTGIARSERNRPAHLADDGPRTPSQEQARAAVERAVAAGRQGADDVAARILDAVEEGRFHVFTHLGTMESVRARTEAALAGEDPPDPYRRPRPAQG